MRRIVKLLGSTVLWLAASSTYGQINLGAIGDSLTDEYLPATGNFHTDLAAKSWLQILGETRSGYMQSGTYLLPPAGGWGDKRGYGYEYNWAKVGGSASRSSVLTVGSTNFGLGSLGSAYGDTQAAGLAQQISGGQVDAAFVGLGSNDFFYRSRVFDLVGTNYPRPGLNTSDPVWQDATAVDVSNAILQHVDTLRAAGTVNIVLGLIPPGTAADVQDPGVVSAIAQANAYLRVGALSRNIPESAIVDLWGWTDEPGRLDAFGNVNVGDMLVLANTKATDPADLSPDGAGPCNSSGNCATLSHSSKYIADDGLHPNTIIQALIANEVLQGLNNAYNAGIPLLSDDEILGTVSINPIDLDSDGLSNSVEESIGTNPMKPDSDGDGVTDSVDNCALISNVNQADSDGDGVGNKCDTDYVPPGCG